ncbi:hypothetical protein CASFOL_007628 [Castilleja foliolosa]|uniref:Transcription factor GAMYB n=1 Tax=Castilleja foliolosa TaxID=1961234 RepID=A0ABD3E544_9LAMI
MGRSSNTESEDGLLSTDSPLSNDGDNFSGGSNGSIVLKKGPWTFAEDAILVDYVKKHGEGNWNAVQKHSGLSRCGKSCRLRWANHLRPNLKKGAFTPEEEQLIIKLHAKMGNKWARMAAHLPGRTDNELKNYWNTRMKRCQRAGLPLYPPDLSVHAQPENQRRLSLPGIYEDKGCPDIMQSNGYGTPYIMFDSFGIPYAPEFPSITGNFSKGNGFGSPQSYSFASQTIGVANFAQEPDESMPEYGRGAASDSDQTDSCVSRMSQSLGLCFAYGPDHTKKLLPFGVNQDSRHMSNVIFSASKHFAGAQKLELPSLQYQETGLGLWDPSPEFSDSIVQSPPLSLPRPSLSSHCPSPGSSGLLEDLLYEAKALSNQSSDWATSSNFSHGDISDSSALKSRSTEFKDYPDPSSPSSIFNIYTPGTIGCSLEDDMPACNVKSEVLNESWILDAESDKKQNHSHCCRPDAMLGSCGCWVSQTVKQQSFFAAETDGIPIGDDLSNNTIIRSLKSPCSWNNMSPSRQMSGIFSVLPNF